MKKSDYIKKYWQYEKRPNIVGAALESNGGKHIQENRLIFQKQIFNDVFFYGIFAGQRDPDISEQLYQIFKEYNWGESFKLALNNNDSFKTEMRKIIVKADRQIYQTHSKGIKDQIKEWYSLTIAQLAKQDQIKDDDELEKLVQVSYYLMTTDPSDKNIEDALRVYVDCVEIWVKEYDQQKITEECCKLLLAVGRSYENIRKIVMNRDDKTCKTFYGDFLRFCAKVCKDTDIIQTVRNIHIIVYAELFNKKIQIDRLREYDLKKEIKILDRYGIQFNLDDLVLQMQKAKFLQPFDDFFYEEYSRYQIDVKLGKTGMQNFNVENEKYWHAHDKFANLKALDSLQPGSIEKVICRDNLVLGNNTTINSNGSTALFVFLDTNNKKIFNVNLGDCLSILKIDEKFSMWKNNMIALNQQDDFNSGHSKAFGDFGHKIDGDVSFEDWSNNSRDGTENNFKILLTNNEAEYSFMTLGRDAQVLIMGCNGIWGTDAEKAVMDIIDAFYLETDDPYILQGESQKPTQIESRSGVTNTLKNGRLKISTKDRFSMAKEYEVENLSGLNTKDITNEQKLILSLAWVSNWSFPNGDNISVICVDLRLLVNGLSHDTKKEGNYYGRYDPQKAQGENPQFKKLATEKNDKGEDFKNWMETGSSEIEAQQDEKEKPEPGGENTDPPIAKPWSALENAPRSNFHLIVTSIVVFVTILIILFVFPIVF